LHASRRLEQAAQVKRTLEVQSPLTDDLRRLADEVALQSGAPEPLLASAGKAVAAGSIDYRDHLGLAAALAAEGRTPEGETVLRRATEAAGDAAMTWIALTAHRVRTGRKHMAATTVETARTTLVRRDATAALAACYELIGRDDQAEELFCAALAARPRDPRCS